MKQSQIVLTVLLVLISTQNATHAQSGPLQLPFTDDRIVVAQGPEYNSGLRHWTAFRERGLAFDYAVGVGSSTWEPFAVYAAANGWAIQTCAGDQKFIAQLKNRLERGENINESCSGYGRYIIILHDQQFFFRDLYTLYAHFDSVDASLPFLSNETTDFTLGKRVQAGDFLGIAGATGKTECQGNPCAPHQAHLHFEVFLDQYKNDIAIGIDPYDISTQNDRKKRFAYPKTLSSCGVSPRWNVCPPKINGTFGLPYLAFEEGRPEVENDSRQIDSIGGSLGNTIFDIENGINFRVEDELFEDMGDGLALSIYSKSAPEQLTVHASWAGNANCITQLEVPIVDTDLVSGGRRRTAHFNKNEFIRSAFQTFQEERGGACKDLNDLQNFNLVGIELFPFEPSEKVDAVLMQGRLQAIDEQVVRYVNFSFGAPFVPGDGRSFSKGNNEPLLNRRVYIGDKFSQDVTVSVYSQDVNILDYIAVRVSFDNSSCSNLLESVSLSEGPKVNGVNGKFFSIDASQFEEIISDQISSGCGDISVPEMFIDLIDFSNNSGNEQPAADAVAIGFGLNVFPNSNTPSP